MEAAVRSRDEDEELHRSTKKVKETHRVDNNSDGTSPRSKGRRSFYKERLIGEIPGAYEQAFNFENEMDMVADSDDESFDLAAGIAAVNLTGASKYQISMDKCTNSQSSWQDCGILVPHLTYHEHVET